MIIKAVNNPRRENGDFGDINCDICKAYSSAYISLNGLIICGGCLTSWLDLIHKTILDDAVRKGKTKLL